MNNKEWKKWIFWFSFAVASIIVYKTIDSVASVFSGIGSFFSSMMPFFMAILLAYILYMPCKKIEEGIDKLKFKFIKKRSRGLSVLIVYVVTALLIFLIMKFVVPTISTSVKELVGNLPNYYNNAIEFFDNLDENSLLAKLNVNKYIKNLQDIDIGEQLTNLVSLNNISSYVKGIVGAASGIFDIFVTIVVSIYILLERTQIFNFLKDLSQAIFNKKTNLIIGRYYRKINGIFFNFICGQIVDAFVIGIVTTIAMSIMKVKYAVLLGFVIGLFNVIPYFGAIAAIIIAIIITIFTGGFIQAIWLAIVVIILQQIDANIINPKILGNSLNLSPILVIFAVTIGGAYFGVLGMFLGVPVIALIKIIIEDFIEFRNDKGFIEKIQSKK